jgi:hypothetical protein
MSFTTPMTVEYLNHEEIKIEDDVTYLVHVKILGPVVLATANKKTREAIDCRLFVQKAECRSDSKEDLCRCAMRQLKKLSAEAHEIARRAAP